MTILLILLLLSAFVCLGYAAFVKIKFNVASISESYYWFDNKYKKGWIFTAWTWVTAFLTFINWVGITPELYQCTTALACAALGIVGICADYKDKDSVMHPLFTCACALLAFVWSILIGLWYIPTVLILCAVIWNIYYNRRRIMELHHKGYNYFKSIQRTDILYWCEVAAFVSIYLSVLIKLL